MTATIIAAGLDDVLKFVEQLPELAVEAAYLAVNDTARDTVPAIKRTMRKQVNFPSGYLNKDRLGIRRKATKLRIEAVISGRDRPTSLARFVENPASAKAGKRPVRVVVKPGRAIKFERSSGKPSAFLVDLKNGNQGLAIRLPKGQAPDDAYKPVPLTRGGGKFTGAWLLYGPSVDQVMKGVADDVQGDVLTMLNSNWLRQISRLTRRG